MLPVNFIGHAMRSNKDYSNLNRFTLFAGLNVLESKDLALKTCEVFQKVTLRFNLTLVFNL